MFAADESEFAADAAHAHVIAETIDGDHEIDFPGSAVRVTWLHRDDDEPGTGWRLLAAVTSAVGAIDGLVAFGAAESRQVTAIREYLR